MIKEFQSSQRINLKEANSRLSSLTASEIIDWAKDTFGDKLYALTSAGIDSALMIDHISRVNSNIPVIHINTGFLPKETTQFKKRLVEIYPIKLIEYRPTTTTINKIKKQKLWETDLQAYSKLTKLEPLTQAVKELGIRALLSGIRGDQTKNRSTLEIIELGNDGEYRIHPFINWTKEEVNEYFKQNNLTRNELYIKGYDSVGDKQVTRAGKDRNGREIMECGLHMVNGRLVRNRQAVTQ
jgi:phosphoadenosine phosphosulfate reductase